MSIFDRKQFNQFASHLRIETKESGIVPLRMLGTQKYLLDEIQKGLEDDKRFFVILKGRQLGISTVSLALDLYWVFSHPGLQGMLATDSGGNLSFFRSILEGYMARLPREYRVPVLSNNRALVEFKNRSRLHYAVAGTRNKGGGSLGRGKGLNFLHSTETSSWGDEEGLDSLMSTLAETNKDRLYFFESTARGFNMFYDMWNDAVDSHTQKAIFVGWWRNEFYQIPQSDPKHLIFWDGSLTGEEQEWVEQVKGLYDFDITPEQIAWWRWKSQELIKDGMMMYQEFPPTEEYAFVATGQQFFSTRRLTEEYRRIVQEPEPKYYRYEIGARFEAGSIRLLETNHENATLTIWEEPVEGATYVVGADPAYGSSETADRFAIQVLRCYSDGLEQVAEYCTPIGYMYSFAWIIAHLAGAYRNSTVLIEVNGPGMAVLQEFRALLERAKDVRGLPPGGIQQVLGNISHFVYRRPDSMAGRGAFLHWKSTADLKERVMNRLRDNFERGTLLIRSRELVEEMRHVKRVDGYIGATGRAHDDLTIALAMALECWAEQVFPILNAYGMTREKSREVLDSKATVLQRTVSGYLGQLGWKG